MNLHRVIAIGLLAIGTVAGCAASAGAQPGAELAPWNLRSICATSSCFLVTDLPGAGVGGKA